MKRDNIYRKRLDKHMDELKWLYMELYNSQDMFDGLLKGCLLYTSPSPRDTR